MQLIFSWVQKIMPNNQGKNYNELNDDKHATAPAQSHFTPGSTYDNSTLCTSVKNTGVTDDVINRDNTEYSSHALVQVVNGKNRNEWVLITRYRTVK